MFLWKHKLEYIIYGNTRKAREPPVRISDDETIIRSQTRKGSDIRTRVRKNNESEEY